MKMNETLNIIAFILFIAIIVLFRSQRINFLEIPCVYTQPDGRQLTLIIKPSGKVYQIFSKDGYALIKNGAKNIEYALFVSGSKLIPSGVLAADPSTRTNLEKHFLSKLNKVNDLLK